MFCWMTASCMPMPLCILFGICCFQHKVNGNGSFQCVWRLISHNRNKAEVNKLNLITSLTAGRQLMPLNFWELPCLYFPLVLFLLIRNMLQGTADHGVKLAPCHQNHKNSLLDISSFTRSRIKAISEWYEPKSSANLSVLWYQLPPYSSSGARN